MPPRPSTSRTTYRPIVLPRLKDFSGGSTRGSWAAPQPKPSAFRRLGVTTPSEVRDEPRPVSVLAELHRNDHRRREPEIVSNEERPRGGDAIDEHRDPR